MSRYSLIASLSSPGRAVSGRDLVPDDGALGMAWPVRALGVVQRRRQHGDRVLVEASGHQDAAQPDPAASVRGWSGPKARPQSAMIR